MDEAALVTASKEELNRAKRKVFRQSVGGYTYKLGLNFLKDGERHLRQVTFREKILLKN